MMKNTQTESKWTGVIYAALAAALFGASTPFAKLLLGETAPVMLAALLYLVLTDVAGVGLALLAMENNALKNKDFYRNIKKHIDEEIAKASEAIKTGDLTTAFQHLERAHIYRTINYV